MSKKGSKILLIIGLIGIALIFLSEFIPGKTAQAQNTTVSAVSADAYSVQLENKLENIIGQIDGVGNVSVMVTLESGVEYVYEQDVKSTTGKTQNSDTGGTVQTQENDDQEQNPVVVDAQNGGQQPLLKTEIQPKVQGVVVVCDGGENPVIKEEVIETVSTALDLAENHISVSKKKLDK